MYSVYLDGWRFPVTPSKLDVKIKGKNKTLTLVNDGEINFLKTPGLTEIDNLEVVFPTLTSYPFAVYTNGFQTPDYFLAKLETLMTTKKPAQFIVSRVSPAGKLLFSTNMKVSVEEYTIKESASAGLDVTVSIKLKQYREFSTKTINIEVMPAVPGQPVDAAGGGGGSSGSAASKTLKVGDIVDFTGNRHYVSSTGDVGYSCKPGKARITIISRGAKHPYHLIHTDSASNVYGWVNASDIVGAPTDTTTSAIAVDNRPATTAPKAKTYTVKSGDCLWNIAKKYTGDGSKYTELYNANKNIIKNPNIIYAGQVLTLPW